MTRHYMINIRKKDFLAYFTPTTFDHAEHNLLRVSAFVRALVNNQRVAQNK